MFSGGLKMHINGTGFSNVGRIMLICHIYQFYEYKERVESKCQVESDENLLCFTPNLEHVDWNNSNLSINNEINNKQVDTSDLDILNIRKKRQINDFRIIYGVTFDNFEFYLNISKTFPKILFYHIFQDPIIYEFENGYKTFYNFGNWIDEFFEISGDRLNIGNISDYTVKLNQNTINIAEKFSNKLIVIPNFENYETCVNQDVIVSFGNINTHVGKLKIYQSIRCHTVWLSVVIIIPIFVVLIIIIIIICIQKRKTPRAGHVTELSYDITQLIPKVYSETVPELIDELKKYDLPSNKLTLYDNIIGSGAYGCVYIGIYDKIKVALKTPKESTPTFVENFMIESSIMAKLSGGNYILKQIGVTVINNRIYSVTPYMNCGDLNNYLKANSNIEIHILFKFMTAIAEGMHYISTKMYVHRDLATRNCLVHNYETVYISDFGLCKELDETGNYISFDHQEKMPLFWCALECLNKHIFNEKSDVWSYGVLVWELFSKGNRPYSDLKDVRQYKKFIEDSHRLKKPKKCPEATYNLMKRCWHQNGDERPSFLNIINSMRKDDYYILPQKI
ncbi:hypothetical protein A3Q56_05685 [Intoshia linei]|uniref:Protein kinase domain-containing protein n=1 Tax=Intoshia linei TaxID=1819745 RepID=A0A177AYW4_9BILA|nr:hypothetical protein A3Q56_05685 [Intoshia linei]